MESSSSRAFEAPQLAALAALFSSLLNTGERFSRLKQLKRCFWLKLWTSIASKIGRRGLRVEAFKGMAWQWR